MISTNNINTLQKNTEELTEIFNTFKECYRNDYLYHFLWDVAERKKCVYIIRTVQLRNITMYHLSDYKYEFGSKVWVFT